MKIVSKDEKRIDGEEVNESCDRKKLPDNIQISYPTSAISFFCISISYIYMMIEHNSKNVLLPDSDYCRSRAIHTRRRRVCVCSSPSDPRRYFSAGSTKFRSRSGSSQNFVIVRQFPTWTSSSLRRDSSRIPPPTRHESSGNITWKG